MNTDIVQSRFLSNPQDLGVVAVGFSKGQVCFAESSDFGVSQLFCAAAIYPGSSVDP